MSYGDEGGAIGYLVGEANKGLGYMFTMMNHARVNVGLEGVGIAERAYQHALWYARERVQGKIIGDTSGEKKTILHHPDVRRMLMDIKSRTEAMRTLAYYAAANIDKALLVVTLREPEVPLTFIDRFLATADIPEVAAGKTVDVEIELPLS